MYSTVDSKRLHSAAWRISLGATLAFAFGTSFVFAGLHRFVANDIQRRSDAWLSGEVEVLGDVAERTPKDRLYDRVVGEVAELASKEVPNKSRDERDEDDENDSVFFLQAASTGPPTLWVGALPSECQGISSSLSSGRGTHRRRQLHLSRIVRKR
jgi:hypothetical protein